MACIKAFFIPGLLAVAAAAAACAMQPEVGPWGYTFALRSVKDVTPNDDVKLMNGAPFRSDAFARSWRKLLADDRVYGTQAAQLDVLLQRYEATRNGHAFALSMDTRLRGVDRYGQVLAETPARCSVVAQEGLGDVGTFGQQVAAQRSLAPLTAAGRDATMWQKVLDLCVKDLAIQFGQALAAGRPATTALR